jgi:NTE family protein
LFRKGDPGVAVRASSAVPGVFEPVKIGGHEYIDGGAVSPIPVRFARQMGADVIIAVDISAIPEGQPTKGAVDILLQTFNIMGHAISQFELQDADVVMRPKLEGVGSAEFSARRLSILAGREAALMVLPQLKERIAAKTR